jgi:glycosyltransferase involved in cell wall biosynthesis
MTTSICYVLPFYSRTDDQHFAHLPRLLAEVAKLRDLYVVVERGGVRPDIAGARMILVQKTDPRRKVRRYFEFLSLVRRVRRAGCRRFFIRISTGAALTLICVRRFFGLEIYYWNSGQGRRAWPQGPDLVTRLRLWVSDRLLMFISRRVDRFVTGPESMVDYYVEEYGIRRSRCIVLYNDVDVSRYQPVAAPERDALRASLDLPREAGCALFVGRVSRYKGGDFILPLARALRTSPETKDVRIVVVGSIHLTHLQPELEAEPNVSLVGARPNDEIGSYLRAADLLILPSLSEGFPRVVIEAMACGLPIAAFDVGGVRDILGPLQQDCVVPRGDVAALSATIRRLASDPHLCEKLRQENLHEVRRFSTDVVARMFVERIVS